MASVLVDSNVLIAARLARDQNHDRARPIVAGFDQGELPTAVVPSNVVEEVLNYLLARSDQGVAIETLDALVESNGFEIQHTPKADFDSGRSLFRKYETLSLTDAILVATMQRQEIEFLYSFDDGFDAVDGITRLTTAENPSE